MKDNEIYELFRNGEYATVIKETEGAKDENLLVIRAASFGLNDQYKEAVATLKNNETILSKNLARLIDVHMQICFWANELIDAQKALAHYEEYPYESQEVEELFKHYQKEIEKEIKSQSKNFYKEEDLIKLLTSDKIEDIQVAISELKRLEILPYLNALKSVLVRKDIDSSTRTLALILLFEKKYGQEVDYYWHNEIIKVIPANCKNTFQTSKFREILHRKNEYKDITFAQTYETLCATYFLYMYPRPVEDDSKDLYTALEIVCRKYLDMPMNKMRQSPNVERLISLIEAANADL